jgi:hypothetical protein
MVFQHSTPGNRPLAEDSPQLPFENGNGALDTPHLSFFSTTIPWDGGGWDWAMSVLAGFFV